MKEKIIFIGLVNMEEFKGDANHFKKLTNYMKSYYNTLIISFTKPVDENYFQIKFPQNKIMRIIYWNISILWLITLLYFKEKPKVIYFRESGLVIAPYLAKLVFNIKLFIEVHGVKIDDTPIPPKLTIFIFKLLYKLPDKFIASIGSAKLISENFGVTFHKIQIVSLGFYFDKEYTKSKICNPPGNINKKIVFIGNIIEYQGLESFIDGFYKLCLETKEDIIFFIIGDGPQKEFLINKVNELNIKDKVKFISSVDENKLKEFLFTCHLGISPFFSNRGKENTISSLKTYDYLNARIPILTSKMDEMAAFIKAEDIGDIIYNYTEEEYKNKILRCLEDGFQEQVKNIYNLMTPIWFSQFSWDTRFNKIKNSLESIMN